MQATIGVSGTLALFTAMALLAAMPSSSVLAVTARAASAGFPQGALTAAGIVAGDLLFVLLAVFGLALLAEVMGPAFIWVKYAAGLYLIGLAALILRGRKRGPDPGPGARFSGWSSFLMGLLITLGDQKAVLFYLGFLPAFIDLAIFTAVDVAVITAVTVLAVGSVKLGYAWAAARAGRVVGGRMGETLNMLAALFMIAAGLWLILGA